MNFSARQLPPDLEAFASRKRLIVRILAHVPFLLMANYWLEGLLSPALAPVLGDFAADLVITASAISPIYIGEIIYMTRPHWFTRRSLHFVLRYDK